MWLLNGKKRTTYAAAWTLVNAHELAVISGMAAAYRLGAAYPKELEEDPFALLCFKRKLIIIKNRRLTLPKQSLTSLSFHTVYLLLSHATIYKKGKNRD